MADIVTIVCGYIGYTAMFSNSASAQSMAQMKYANSGSAGSHLGSGMTGFTSSFSATKQIEGECHNLCYDDCFLLLSDI